MVWATVLAAPLVLEPFSAVGKVPGGGCFGPSGSLLGDTDVLAQSLGVAGGARCAISSLCDAFNRSFNDQGQFCM